MIWWNTTDSKLKTAGHDLIKINNIPFTPNSRCDYKNNYFAVAKVIETPWEWKKALGLPDDFKGKLTRETVQKIIYRELVLTDLWFILYFVMGVPEHIANTPFAVNQCKLIEDDDFNSGGHRQPTLDIWARSHLKALAIDEPVPTPKGFKKHGDLEAGDKIFSPKGEIINVIGKSPIFYNKDCYRIKFDTGYSVIASGDHLWTVEISNKARINKSNLRTGYKTVTMSTKELMNEVNKSLSLKTRILPRIPVSLPVFNYKKKLPIDPYVLGVWLGDGTAGGNKITAGLQDYQEIIKNIEESGYKTSFTTRQQWTDKTRTVITISIDPGIKGKRGSSKFINNLRLLGILKDKHIPESYMNSGVQNRFSLLQGLMDTDGTVHKKHSQISLTSSKYELAKQIYILISSLGIKCSLKKENTACNGKIFSTWWIHFTPKKDSIPFRLKRKRDRCKIGYIRQSRYRMIKEIIPVSSVPTSCIKVDSQDGLYLFGEEYIATHNTSLISIAETIQYHLKYPEFCTIVFAYKKGLAEKIVNSTRRAYESEFLKYLFLDRLYMNPLNESPLWTIEKGLIIKRKNKARIEPTIYASGLTEGMAQGFHCERLVFDDIETEDMTGNPDVLNDVFSKFQMAQYLETKTIYDRQRVLGTIYSHLGPIIRIKELKNKDGKTPKYKTRIIPGTEDGSFDGKPVFWSQKILDKEKLSPHYAMQVLCNPTPAELRKLKSQYLREIEPNLIPRNILKFMLVDWAGDNKGKRDGCDWAILTVGVECTEEETAANKVYLLDCVAAPMPTVSAVDFFVRMYLAHGVIQKVGIEKSSGDAIKYFAVEMLKQKGRILSEECGNLEDLNPRGRNKDERILNGLETPLVNGKLFLSKAIPEPVRKKIILELDQFPYGKKDVLDAWSYLPDLIKNISFSQYRGLNEIEYKQKKYQLPTIAG